MNAICLITRQPSKIWCEFLNNFDKYKIFIIIDNNQFNLTDFNYNNINFIKIDEKKCREAGYIHSSTFYFHKQIIGWDKALYYFGVENINYDYIWFLEDDVFFNSQDTLLNIDKEYFCEDLLSNTINEHFNVKNKWVWNRININYPLPYYNGMICIVRVSKRMVECINKYALENKTIFFVEALFPTICNKNNLNVKNPTEFKEVHYRKVFTNKDYNDTVLFHPLKDINKHVEIRKLLTNN
jgi:hypothetical protein